jgi:hypothetical protein
VNRAVFVTSGKGGITKTKLARLVGELHREGGTGAVLVDADRSVGQFLKHLGVRDTSGALLNPQPLEGVVSLDWHNDVRGRDEIAELFAHRRNLVVDMPGGSLESFRVLDEEAGFFDIAESLGFAATFISPITPWVETWADAAKIRAWLPNVDQVLVVNEDFGSADDFMDWRESNTRKTLLESGSREVVLPALPSGIAANIAKHRLRFHDAPTSPHLRILHQGRAGKWLVAATAALLPVASVLGLDGDTKAQEKSKRGAA